MAGSAVHTGRAVIGGQHSNRKSELQLGVTLQRDTKMVRRSKGNKTRGNHKLCDRTSGKTNGAEDLFVRNGDNALCLGASVHALRSRIDRLRLHLAASNHERDRVAIRLEPHNRRGPFALREKMVAGMGRRRIAGSGEPKAS